MATRSRPPVPVIVLVVLLLAGGGFWWWWTATQSGPVDTALRASGTAESRQYQIAPALTGRIASVAVAEGDRVTAGQEIAALDRAALELQLKQAEQGVKDAAAAVTNAEKDKDATKADVTAAKARKAQAEAGVDLAKLQLEYTSVTAPRTGLVVSLTAAVGENTAPGRTLATLVDPDDVFVRVFVPEPRIGEISVGQQVSLSIGSGEPTPGTVSFISSEAEFTPSTVQTEQERANLVYEVRIAVAQPEVVRAGLPVDVVFG